MNSNFDLPANLPHPIDDSSCAHLTGMQLPAISLPSTSGRNIELSKLTAARTVIYVYPMTGVPGKALPEGWDAIPGARGCTPQSCGFRDHFADLEALDVGLFGLSTQSTDYQREVVERLHLPFELLSDAEFKLTEALCLPTFEIDGMRLIKRLTMIIRDGAIEGVLYPVFPPNDSARQTLDWLCQHPIS